LLYSYEKAVWNSTELLMADVEIKNIYRGYIVQHSRDSITVTFVDNNQQKSIVRFLYVLPNLENPVNIIKEISNLTRPEQILLEIRIKIFDQLSADNYNIQIPQGYNPNFVLIKKQNGYDLYIIMGTSKSGIIPSGNDYLFRTDFNGIIIMWKKFHSRLIPVPSKAPDDEKIKSTTHSHLKTTPYITATDICTFRLYGKLCDMDEFTVLCTATGKFYKYNINTNKISIAEK